MAPTALLIIISGPPATGKSTLACDLSARYGLPLFTKDRFKEMMYDNAPQSTDLATSRFYGKCSIDALQITTRELLSHRISHIIEANFDSALFSPFVRALADIYSFHCLQIQMTCAPDVLEKRFFERAYSAARHPGHIPPGMDILEVVRPSLATGKSEPLDIEGDIAMLDTTHPASYSGVYAMVEQLLSAIQGRSFSQ